MSDRLVLRAAVSPEALDLAAHVALVSDPRCGAVVTFTGVVRNHAPDADGEVTTLDYSHHPSAAAELARIAQDVLDAHPDEQTVRMAVTHRVGRLQVGDLAVVAAVATPHRQAAFAVGEELIEAVKHRLPVWKRQQTASGTGNWVGIEPVSPPIR